MAATAFATAATLDFKSVSFCITRRNLLLELQLSPLHDPVVFASIRFSWSEEFLDFKPECWNFGVDITNARLRVVTRSRQTLNTPTKMFKAYVCTQKRQANQLVSTSHADCVAKQVKHRN